MRRTVYLAFCYIACCLSHVLVTTPWEESTVYPNIPLKIARLLTSHGIQVTYLALEAGQEQPEQCQDTTNKLDSYAENGCDKELDICDADSTGLLSCLTGKVPGLRGTEHLHEVAERSGALGHSSSTMIRDSITGSTETLDQHIEQLGVRFGYYLGPETEDILRNVSLVIAEETVSHAIALTLTRLLKQGTISRIPPIVTVLCITDQHRSRIEQNLPTLLTSEAGQFLNLLKTPPDLLARLQMWWGLGRFVVAVLPRVVTIFEPYLAEAGVGSLTDLDHLTQLYLVNDHPALSFANFAPPNSVNVAGLNYRKPEPLPRYVAEFMELCEGRTVLVRIDQVGFQTRLVGGDTVGQVVLETLRKDKFCVLLSESLHGSSGKEKRNVDLNTAQSSEARILDTHNTPLSDLLGSGAITLFISQCGNGERISGALHRVPLVCIPLFADQYANSIAVLRRGLGGMVTREELTVDRLGDEIGGVLKEEVVKRLERAAEAVMGEPRISEVVFYVRHLLKYGDLAYLKNEIILQQSLTELYNLDIKFMIFILVGFIGFVIVRTIYMCTVAGFRFATK